jgi:tetratricopeptide (TPR) repeat protein
MTARALRLPFEAMLLLLALAAVSAVHGTNRWLESRRVEQVADGNVGILPDGNVVRVLSLGFERVVADLFWIRTVDYIGDENSATAGWPGAERLANLVTDVDPHFDSAYVVMASVLNGLRKDPDAAIRLLEKGAAVSSYWRIHFLLGFQYFMEKQDYVQGARCLERAFALGGPPYLQFLISRLYTSAGDPTTAMQFIALRLKNEETPAVREQLEKRLSDLWINRDLALIDTAVAKYRDAAHAAPKNVQALVDAKLLPALPRDPKGGEYWIDGQTGRAVCGLEYDDLKLKTRDTAPAAKVTK